MSPTIGQIKDHVFGVLAKDIYGRANVIENKKRFDALHGKLAKAYTRLLQNFGSYINRDVDELVLFCRLADAGYAYLDQIQADAQTAEMFCQRKIYDLGKKILARYGR